MGSKINTTYWGSNVNPYSAGGYTYGYGLSSNNIRNLVANGAYSPNTDSFDLSVSPWGIGYSAAGNRGQIAIQRQGSVDGNAPGIISKISFEGIDRENSNRPFYMPNSGAGGARDNYYWIMARVGGDCDVDSSNYIIDKRNSQILAANSTSSSCISNQYACTYLDYQKYKLKIAGFHYIDLDTGSFREYYFTSNTQTVEQAKQTFANWNFPEHMAIVNIIVSPVGYGMEPGQPTGWGSSPVPGRYGLMQMRGHTIGDAYLFNKISYTQSEDEKYKLFAQWTLGPYGVRSSQIVDSTIPSNYYSSSPYVRNIPVEGQDYRTNPNSISYQYINVCGLGVGVDNDYSTTLISNYCDKEQSFSDITYKQRPFLFKVNNSVLTEIKEGYYLQTGYGQFRATAIYEVSGSDTFTRDQILSLIKHEVAFYGFEFYISWGNASAATFEVGSDDLYLPKFDEHLITTGNYTSGTASLSEPNATWGNVFDDNMPDYDYEYNPSPQPGPGGGETPWDDNPITRIQEGYWTGLGGTTYMSSLNDFAACLGDVKNSIKQRSDSLKTMISAAFTNHPDPIECQAVIESYKNQFIYGNSTDKGYNDFTKGGTLTNYTDCVLSVIRYPFDISEYFTTTGIDNQLIWGNVITPVNGSGTTVTTVRELSGYQTGKILQGGSLYVEKRYDNFLNYAPYTTAELYIPYCGSVPIDLEVFAGHTIQVKYLVDWFSGACLALIYRDSVVVDQIPGQIGTSVGIVAEDIQSYQNAMFNGSQTLKAQKAALRGSIVNGMGQSMDQLSGAIGNVATAILGGEPSSSNSQSGGGAFASGFGTGNAIAQNYQNVKTAKYNLDHTTIDFKQIGSNGPSLGSWNEQVCRLVLYYPTFLPEYNPSEYGHTVGFACLFNKTLSEFSGLTVCSSVDTSGLTDATESEKTLIEDALKSGVYL